MKAIELRIAKVQNRGNKFGIVAGASVIRRFKTVDQAQNELNNNRGFYEYWAGSASVAVDNSPKKFIYVS